MSTPGVTQPASSEMVEWVQTWAQSLAQVLAQVGGSPFGVDSVVDAPPDVQPVAETDLYGIATAGGTLRGEMSFRLPRATVLTLAQLLLSEPVDPAVEFKGDHRDAAEELLRQVAGQAATALKPRWGELQLGLEFVAPPSWSPGESGWIVSAAGAPAAFWLEWQASAALVAALRASQAPSSTPEISAAGGAGTADAAFSPESGSKLDLLMDVELGVTLRFGGRRMLLREILELGPGSVVELDRQVQEPADLLLDGKLIARGEVVVVDGNYGLRVLEVIAAAVTP